MQFMDRLEDVIRANGTLGQLLERGRTREHQNRADTVLDRTSDVRVERVADEQHIGPVEVVPLQEDIGRHSHHVWVWLAEAVACAAEHTLQELHDWHGHAERQTSVRVDVKVVRTCVDHARRVRAHVLSGPLDVARVVGVHGSDAYELHGRHALGVERVRTTQHSGHRASFTVHALLGFAADRRVGVAQSALQAVLTDTIDRATKVMAKQSLEEVTRRAGGTVDLIRLQNHLVTGQLEQCVELGGQLLVGVATLIGEQSKRDLLLAQVSNKVTCARNSNTTTLENAIHVEEKAASQLVHTCLCGRALRTSAETSSTHHLSGGSHQMIETQTERSSGFGQPMAPQIHR
mmetsp:Transcript_25749/g.64660  ORF Transcript_25749/g.64660 Transcript_25749/m.64660 type:complete len:347 (+) Transcript_25749:107-1147(+)